MLAQIAIVAAPVWIALAIDRWLGEPPVRLHPVVWIGNYLGAVGKRIAPAVGSLASTASKERRAVPFIAGALAWCAGAIVVAGVAWALQRMVLALPWWVGVFVLGALLKPLLAWRMLRDEVLAVEAALAVSLDAGRTQLARLVSRDVNQLSRSEVRESAIESLAENLNDSVVAPVFWFLLLGLPGAAVYRFANTADAMWGYIGERNGRDWTWAGKWAARADDVLSWIPARLTALLLLPFSMRLLIDESARTPSPNSGWPMAAMALRLGVKLGKPGVYTINAKGRDPMKADVVMAARLGEVAVVLLACLAAGSAVLLISWMLAV